ncbi:PAS domain-containing sensor histidine kinase [Phenylobacterium sp.]|uniref:PAS domain-containing sensor histidine kinase n=1 Tax=Phenylobacterium sp. TaxID=1871053 RepID=UPI0025F2285D|nr:PAS domain-containing sensor histidine kinase [Phenylobacterium sp.]
MVFIAIGVVTIALAALLGWQTGNVVLTSVVVGAIALQPTTAVALIIGATGLVGAAVGRRWLARIAGVVLLAACAIWLAAYASPHAVPIDLMLYRRAVLAQRPSPLWPGRPSLITCAVIALYAASLLGVGVRQRWLKLLALSAASLGALLASLSILPFLLQDPSQLTILHQSLRIALNTSVGVGALCAGALILKRDAGWVRLVASGGEQGRMARLLTPVALIPIAFGTLANIGVRTDLYGPDVRMLLIIVLSAVALLFLAFWAAQMLGRERTQRDSLAKALERSTVMIVDGHGKLRHWPAACEALYGWTAAEVLGRRPGEFLNVEGASVREATRAAIRDHGEWRGEIQHWTKTGAVRWVALQWVLQKGASDEEDRVVGTISDITDLKLAEASLRESQERLTLAISGYDLGIGDSDVLADRLIADEGLERIFGVGPGEMNGSLSGIRGRMVVENLDEVLRLADAAVAERRPYVVDDVTIRRPDGEVRRLHGVRRFFYSAAGVHERTITVYRDVTEEWQAQAELALRGDHLAQLRSELAHVSRLSAMGEMAAALAHELNQPLTAIGNSVGALKIMLSDGGRELDETARGRIVRAANQAEGQAVRAGEIVRRLRDFIARGEADARIEQLDRLIEDAVALGAPNAKADGIEVCFDFSPKAARILADRIQIQQILVNLVRNANEAMRDQPKPHILTISTAAKRGMVEVSVRDSGPGVAPDLSTRLFSPFVSTKNDGMGVGLSICRRIVEAHGGRMWLEEPCPRGGGADFRFTIPLATKELQHA